MSSLLLVVTGASRGLGQAIAAAFVKNEISSVPLTHVRAVLVARSKEGLQQTEQRLKEEADKAQPKRSLEVSSHVMDLSNLDELDQQLNDLFQHHIHPTMHQYQRRVLINSAASLGHVGPCIEMKSLKDFQHSIDLNMTSSLWLSVRFVQEMGHWDETSTPLPAEASCIVVNISSLCASDPFPTMATYCAGKAARDMFHSVMDLECNDYDHIKMLNYAPGACETDMTTELRMTDRLDEGLKSFYRTSYEEGTLVHPDDTSRRLVNLVMKNEFESGKHIDYWDLTDD